MRLVSSRRHPLKIHQNASSPFDVFLWWDTNPDGNNRPLWTIKKSNLSVTTPKAQRGSAFVNKLFPGVDGAASAGSPLLLSRITQETAALHSPVGTHAVLLSFISKQILATTVLYFNSHTFDWRNTLLNSRKCKMCLCRYTATTQLSACG